MSFLIPFVSIMLAEFGDKTMLAVLLLASKTRKHLLLWLGVMLAFLLVDGAAVVVGSVMPHMLPLRVLKIASGVLFVIGGTLILANRKEEEAEAGKAHNPFVWGFLMIFTAEWGDKTQIASGLFAARFPALPVLAGVISGLGVLSAVSIFGGKFLSKKIPAGVLQKAAAVIFILMGIYCFL